MVVINIKSILDMLNPYATLINSFLTAVTIIVSICAIGFSRKNAKNEIKQLKEESRKQQDRYEEESRNQRDRYEEEKRRHDEIARLHEQPYLVFKKAKISPESEENIKKIDILFTNKGQGSAYNIVPDLKCEVNPIYNNGIVELTRCDPIQDPIAVVGEEFKTMWTLGYKVELVSFTTTISINYSDASGRKYVQRFNIIFNKEGYASITNFAQPELYKG